MVHILNEDKIDIELMSMLYNLLSNKENKLYLVTDSLYLVPNWSDIVSRAKYWFSEVHLVVGLPFYTTMRTMNTFDSVNIRFIYEDGTIFSKTVEDEEFKIHRNTLTTKVTYIGAKKDPRFYKNMHSVQYVTNEYPFGKYSTLIDEDLKVYNNLDSRLGDL